MFAAQDAKEQRDFELSRQKANRLDGYPSNFKKIERECVTPQGEIASGSGDKCGQLEKDEEFVFEVHPEEDIVYETNLDLLADIDFAHIPKSKGSPGYRMFLAQRMAKHLLHEFEASAKKERAIATAGIKRARRKQRARMTGNQRDKKEGRGRFAPGYVIKATAPAKVQPLDGIIEDEDWSWEPSVGAWEIV